MFIIFPKEIHYVIGSFYSSILSDTNHFINSKLFLFFFWHCGIAPAQLEPTVRNLPLSVENNFLDPSHIIYNIIISYVPHKITVTTGSEYFFSRKYIN